MKDNKPSCGCCHSAESDRPAILGGKPTLAADLPRQNWPQFNNDDIQAVTQVLKEQHWASDAPQALALEAEWCRYSGAKFCRATSSGTSALHTALYGVGVQPGDEVLVPAYTFMSSGYVVLHQCAIPIFVDIDIDTFTIDPKKIEAQITEKTKAIMAVHLFGLPADMDPILAIAKKHKLAVIEDCAQAHGATYKGKQIMTIGDAAGASINGAKNLLASEGGLFTTNREDVYKRSDDLSLRITLSGKTDESKYPLHTIGFNYRINTLGAALARSQLRRLDAFNAFRRSNAERMSGILSKIPGVVPPKVPSDRTHVWHMYRVRFDPKAAGVSMSAKAFKEKIAPALTAEGVPNRAWMAWTMPDRSVFQQLDAYGKGMPWSSPLARKGIRYNPAEYPEARCVVDETVMLPDVPLAKSSEIIDLTGEAFRKVFGNLDAILKA